MTSTLFLDIDGVLNSAKYIEDYPGCCDRQWATSMLDPAACARLERVLAATGAEIVVSSAWRVLHSPEEIQGYLHERGVLSARVVGETPAAWLNGGREAEIQAYLDDHPEITRYAIVDDMPHMGALSHSFVSTTWALGLLDEHVSRLVALLEP